MEEDGGLKVAEREKNAEGANKSLSSVEIDDDESFYKVSETETDNKADSLLGPSQPEDKLEEPDEDQVLEDMKLDGVEDDMVVDEVLLENLEETFEED